MEPISILAIVAVVVGGIYLVLAAFASSRSGAGGGNASNEPENGVVLNIAVDPLLSEGEPTRDRMRKLAALAASTASRAFGESFDYSVESVARLDRAIVSGWGEGDGEVREEVVLSFGAYLGEVLVRRSRGRWVTGLTDDDPATVLFVGSDPDDVVSFSPFMLIREKFGNIYGFDLAIAFTALEQTLKEARAA